MSASQVVGKLIGHQVVWELLCETRSSGLDTPMMDLITIIIFFFFVVLVTIVIVSPSPSHHHHHIIIIITSQPHIP
jgi:hypothetical protein